jgi:hypothetical protein
MAGRDPGTGVNESAHDITFLAGQGLNGNYVADDFQRVCVFCHTPHNALPNGAVPAPLWNHAPSNVVMQPYDWAAPANAAITFDIDPLIGPSRLCMACHDGVTAVDSHGSSGSDMNGNNPMTRTYVDGLGNTTKRFIEDLAVTHPIGFRYADAEQVRNANGMQEIVPAATLFLTSITASDPNTKTRGAGWNYGNKRIADTLYSGYFTCASCHEVHNTNNVASAPATSDGHIPNYFLWSPEEKSTICLSCHVK